MNVVWSDVIGELVTAILKIMVPICITLLLKWGAELYKKIREGNPQLADLIKYAAQLGYAAAEEFFRNDENATGSKKLEHAISEAEQYLKQFNVKVDLNVVKDAIIAYGVENYKFNWCEDQKLNRYLYDEIALHDFQRQMAEQNADIHHEGTVVLDELTSTDDETKEEGTEKDAATE